MGKKKKILTGGGLGDALMVYSKLYNFEDFELTHVEVPDKLLPAIDEFYKSQGIKAEVLKIPNWNWKRENLKNYDLFLDTSAYGIEMENPIEIDPFPNLNWELSGGGHDIVLSPSSGRDNERSFSFNEIKKFCNKYSDNYNICLVGTETIESQKRYNNIDGVDNYINNTSIRALINIVSNGRVLYIISPSGFISFLGCMAGKIVFTKDGRKNIEDRYYHKEWNNKFIRSLNQVELC